MDQMTLLCLVAETSEIVPLGGQKLKRQTGFTMAMAWSDADHFCLGFGWPQPCRHSPAGRRMLEAGQEHVDICRTLASRSLKAGVGVVLVLGALNSSGGFNSKL